MDPRRPTRKPSTSKTEQLHHYEDTPMKLKLIAAAAALAFSAGTADAHQTFLISDLPELRPGTDNFLILKNGTFFESGYSITQKMSHDISLVMDGKRSGPDQVKDVDTNPEYTSTYIKVFAEKEGTGLAAMAAHPDYIAMPAPMFLEYLAHEGLDDAIEEFKRVNDRDTIRERYTKHAKGIFQVGDKLTDDYKTPLGYKLEVFIDQNPGSLKVGDTVDFTVLYDGKPAANLPVFVNHAGNRHPDQVPAPKASVYQLRTDAEGRGSFEITEKNKWYMQMIHMQKVNDKDADWESNWATLNFHVMR